MDRREFLQGGLGASLVPMMGASPVWVPGLLRVLARDSSRRVASLEEIHVFRAEALAVFAREGLEAHLEQDAWVLKAPARAFPGFLSVTFNGVYFQKDALEAVRHGTFTLPLTGISRRRWRRVCPSLIVCFDVSTPC